jgi:nucleoside 2-deoxyribosyltransferase
MAGERVYVAGPLGFSDSGRAHQEVEVLGALRSAGFEPLDPWRHPAPPGAPGSQELHAATRRYGAQNAEDIRSADAVLAILDGSDVDSGTAGEVGYACALGIPVVGLRTDLRRSGENDTVVVNLQVQWFVESSGGRVERTLEDAIAALVEVLAAPS